MNHLSHSQVLRSGRARSLLGAVELISLVFLMHCSTPQKPASDTGAFEENERWFSGKIDRIYLAYLDPTPNTGRIPGAEGLEFPLDNQDGLGKPGEKYDFHYGYDNPPPLASEQESSKVAPLELSVVYCKDEPFHDYWRDNEKTLGSNPRLPFSLLPETRTIHNLQGYQSDARFTCNEIPCMPFNERIRLNDFTFKGSAACELISRGGSLSSDFEKFSERGGVYADRQLAPQVGDWIGAGMSAMTCATLLAGPAIKAMTITGEKLVESAVNTSALSRAAGTLGLSLVNTSYQLNQVGIAIGNVLKSIKIFGFGSADKLLTTVFMPYAEVVGPFNGKLRSAFVMVVKQVAEDLASNNGHALAAVFLKTMLTGKHGELLLHRLGIDDAKRKRIAAAALSAAGSEASLVKVLDELEQIETVAEAAALREGIGDPRIIGIIAEACKASVDPDAMLDLALQGAALVIPGAACVEAVTDGLRIYGKIRRSENLRNFLAAMDSTRLGTEAFLDEHYPAFKALKQKVTAEPGDIAAYAAYQGVLMPQTVYAFNKIQQQERFRNGINPFQPHAALEELRTAIDDIESSAPEIALLINVGIVMKTIKSIPDKTKLLGMGRAALQAAMAE